ncbi:HalOD1 output domain-containing protein [Natrinema sp. DC36]|uniref:HalOD1 output domain-containing protein n=1 Tax=Natrinema sp. DC36 TaxID=2878680 RepID=UPI001CF0B218|nr:HalOD1 output domain-containing protein [Natrinema sp. DC36]
MESYNQHQIAADGGSGVVVEEQPWESIVQTVIRGIAAVKGTPECDLDPLYNSINPEALNELMRHSQRISSDVSVEFTHEGCTVLVRNEDPMKITDSPPDEIM